LLFDFFHSGEKIEQTSFFIKNEESKEKRKINNRNKKELQFFANLEIKF